PPASHGSAMTLESGRPTWGPDGKVFMTGEMFHYSDRFREGTNQIVSHSIDSERPLAAITLAVHHSAGNRENNGPVWSPDGAHMAYVSEGRLMVVAVAVSGAPLGPPIPVAADSPDSPSWQADSEHLVYLTPSGLRRTNASGGDVQRIACELAWTPPRPPDR